MRCCTSWLKPADHAQSLRRGRAAAAGVQDAALGHGLCGARAAAAGAEASHRHRRLQLRTQGAQSRARSQCAASPAVDLSGDTWCRIGLQAKARPTL